MAGYFCWKWLLLFFHPVDLSSGFQENKKKPNQNSAFSRSFIVKHNLRFQKLVVRRFWLPLPFMARENTEDIVAIIPLGTEGHQPQLPEPAL